MLLRRPRAFGHFVLGSPSVAFDPEVLDELAQLERGGGGDGGGAGGDDDGGGVGGAAALILVGEVSFVSCRATRPSCLSMCLIDMRTAYCVLRVRGHLWVTAAIWTRTACICSRHV